MSKKSGKSCRLCGLVNKVLNEPATHEAWRKEVAIEDEKGNLNEITLRGVTYIFENGKTETVRALYEDSVFVNPTKDYSDVYRDIVIAVPFVHASNKKFMTEYRAQFALFMNKVCGFVESEYQGAGARIMINDGRFASVPEHLHAQIIQVKRTETLIPEKVQNY